MKLQGGKEGGFKNPLLLRVFYFKCCKNLQQLVSPRMRGYFCARQFQKL